MQGKPRTRATDDLGLIFFKIRTTRDTATRRSWTRRARLALAKREDLTPADRHEIMCVWSKADSHRIDSPAMSKLWGLNHAASELKTIKASSVCRRRFDVKKPAFSGLSSNDDVFSTSEICTVSRIDRTLRAAHQHRENDTYRNAVFPSAFPPKQGYISPHFYQSTHGRNFSLCDTGFRQFDHYQQTPHQPQTVRAPQTSIFSWNPLCKFTMNRQYERFLSKFVDTKERPRRLFKKVSHLSVQKKSKLAFKSAFIV